MVPRQMPQIVVVAHQRLSSATRSNDDIDWPVHSLMLSFHDAVRRLPSKRTYSFVLCSLCAMPGILHPSVSHAFSYLNRIACATDFLTTGNDIVSHIAGSRVECFEYDNMAASPPHAASVLFAAVAARGASGLYNLLGTGRRGSVERVLPYSSKVVGSTAAHATA